MARRSPQLPCGRALPARCCLPFRSGRCRSQTHRPRRSKPPPRPKLPTHKEPPQKRTSRTGRKPGVRGRPNCWPRRVFSALARGGPRTSRLRRSQPIRPWIRRWSFDAASRKPATPEGLCTVIASLPQPASWSNTSAKLSFHATSSCAMLCAREIAWTPSTRQRN
jgi:hypothetical protein